MMDENFRNTIDSAIVWHQDKETENTGGRA